jgi:hypothetical protein
MKEKPDHGDWALSETKETRFVGAPAAMANPIFNATGKTRARSTDYARQTYLIRRSVR